MLPYAKSLTVKDDSTHRLLNQTRAFHILLFGAPHFFTPRLPPPVLFPAGSADAVSFYDVSPLRATLERLVDFDRINAQVIRFSVGAVNVRSGNFVYFDNTRHHKIGPEHVMASGSLPPGFPATLVEGDYYWDGGIVSNTPLQWVLDAKPRRDTLAFQVDLWNARGQLPRDLPEAEVRQKEIQFSGTAPHRSIQARKAHCRHIIKRLPADVDLLASEADERSTTSS
jgi:NTE family protein